MEFSILQSPFRFLEDATSCIFSVDVLLIEEMPQSLKALLLKFSCLSRLRPSVQYAPRHGNTGRHFPVFLSGHLHKFDITCAAQNSWQNSHSNSCAGHMTFCLDAHVRKTKKRCPRCFCGTDILSGLSNLRKTGNIDIVESSFLGICAFPDVNKTPIIRW